MGVRGGDPAGLPESVAIELRRTAAELLGNVSSYADDMRLQLPGPGAALLGTEHAEGVEKVTPRLVLEPRTRDGHGPSEPATTDSHARENPCSQDT